MHIHLQRSNLDYTPPVFYSIQIRITMVTNKLQTNELYVQL